MLPFIQADSETAEVYSDREGRRLTGFFNRLYQSLADKRMNLLPREDFANDMDTIKGTLTEEQKRAFNPKPIELKKGECSFHHPLMVHGSYENRTDPKELCREEKWGKGKVKRLLGVGAGLIFKGSGFYITDYRSNSYKEAAKKEAPAAPTSSDSGSGKDNAEGKSDAKGAPAMHATSTAAVATRDLHDIRNDSNVSVDAFVPSTPGTA